MIPLIEVKRTEVGELCRRYGVRRLEVFGSAARGSFDPETSDLDFLVELAASPREARRCIFRASGGSSRIVPATRGSGHDGRHPQPVPPAIRG